MADLLGLSTTQIARKLNGMNLGEQVETLAHLEPEQAEAALALLAEGGDLPSEESSEEGERTPEQQQEQEQEQLHQTSGAARSEVSSHNPKEDELSMSGLIVEPTLEQSLAAVQDVVKQYETAQRVTDALAGTSTSPNGDGDDKRATSLADMLGMDDDDLDEGTPPRRGDDDDDDDDDVYDLVPPTTDAKGKKGKSSSPSPSFSIFADERERKAASLIAAKWKAVVARREFEKTKRAAAVIQTRARGASARRKVKRMRNQNDEDDVDDNDDKKTPSPTTSRRRGGSKKDESNKGNAAAKQKAGGAASMSVEQMEKGISNPELARLASKLAAWVHALDRRVLAYFKMFALVFALAVYAYVLADQRQAGASFDMARSIRDAVVPSTREFTSSMAAQTWIEQTVSSSWVDDPCGNGVCDAALGREVPGFGGEGSDAHGCVADCGRVADIPGAGRTLLLHIKSNIADSAAATGVSATTAELSADVEWNVCLSEDRRTCYYASSQKLGILGSGNEVVTLHNLPTDSAWTMHVMGDWFHAVSWELKNKNDVAESATRAKKEVASTCGASRYLQKEQVALESSAALLASTFDNALETLATFEANSTAIDLSANLTSGILTQAEHDARLQAAIDKKNSTLTSLSELRKVCAMNQTLAGCTDLVRQAGDAVPVAESAARALLSEAKQYAQDEALSCAQGFLKELREKMDYLLALEISLAVGPYASDVEKASLQTLLNDQIAKLNIQSKYTSALQPASVASLPKATLESTVLARIAEVKYALQAQPKEISGIVPAPTIALLAGASTAYQTFAIGRRASAYAGSCQNRTNTIRYPDIAKCALVCECPATCTATQFCGCETCAVDPPPPPATTTTTTATTTNATTTAAAAASDAASSKRRRHLSQASPIAQTLENLESNQGTILAEARQIERNVAMLESTIKSSAGANLDDMITASLSSLDTELRHMSAELERAMFGRASTIQLSTPRAISPSLTRARLNAFAQRMTSKPSEINNALAAKIADVDKAVAEGVIDAASADKLRDQAREDALKLEKAAIIANMPCSVLGRSLNIPSGRSAAGASAVRVRTLGGDVNRIVGGLLVQTVREREGSCPKSRFDSLNGQVSCGDGLTNAPYGSDIPSSSASSFTDDEVRKFIQYNCSKIGQSSSQRHVTARATYPLNRTAFTDPVEYCSEMYDARGMPFAFYSPVKRLAAFRDRGYPLYFDIDMSSSEAQSLAAFAKNGGFVDDSLLHMDARIAVWNSELRRFGYVKLRFHRGDSGLIRVEPTIRSAKMSAYETTSDYVRLAFEITLISLAVLDMGITTYGLITSPAYRRSLSSKIDVISILFFLGVIAFWYFIAFGVTDDFSVNLRYDVYAIPYGPPSSPVLPGNSQTSLHALADKMSDLDRICDLLTYYFVLAGACLFLLLCRTLTSMTFQPRLGAFVNTVHYAGADLVNFLCVFLMCLIAYALIGHVVFGDLVDSLSTVPKALVALVEVVLGDTKFNAELMRETDYNDYLHANAILYFWSYAMLQLGLSFGFVIAIFINSHDSERQRLVQEYGTDGEPGVLREIGLLVKSLVDSDGGMRTLRRFVRSIGGDDAKYSARDAYRRAGQTPVESKVLTTPSDVIALSELEDAIDAVAEGEDFDTKVAARRIMASLGVRAESVRDRANPTASTSIEVLDVEAEKEARESLMARLDDVLDGQRVLEDQHKMLLDYFLHSAGAASTPSTGGDAEAEPSKPRTRRRVRKI